MSYSDGPYYVSDRIPFVCWKPEEAKKYISLQDAMSVDVKSATLLLSDLKPHNVSYVSSSQLLIESILDV